jgi:hypothetical protein
MSKDLSAIGMAIRLGITSLMVPGARGLIAKAIAYEEFQAKLHALELSPETTEDELYLYLRYGKLPKDADNG